MGEGNGAKYVVIAMDGVDDVEDGDGMAGQEGEAPSFMRAQGDTIDRSSWAIWRPAFFTMSCDLVVSASSAPLVVLVY